MGKMCACVCVWAGGCAWLIVIMKANSGFQHEVVMISEAHGGHRNHHHHPCAEMVAPPDNPTRATETVRNVSQMGFKVMTDFRQIVLADSLQICLKIVHRLKG